MKFKFEKLEVGSTVIITDCLGRSTEAKVLQINSADDPIQVEYKTGATLRTYPSHPDFVFRRGHVSTFYADGKYVRGDSKTLRITHIKKSWKPLTGHLHRATKVRVRYEGRFIKGIATNRGSYYEVQFEEPLDFPDNTVASLVDYYLDGTPMPGGNFVIHSFK